MVRPVFLLPLPHPIRLYPDRANRALAPIRDSLAAENRVRRPSHPWVFPAGSRTLPVVNRCQFALAPDAPAPPPQNFPDQRAQLPAYVKAWATANYPLSAQPRRLEREGPCPSTQLAPVSSPHSHF